MQGRVTGVKASGWREELDLSAFGVF